MPRGLDHLVLATRDLDASAALYRRLGFTVGARNRHDWGTLNHIVQLDGTFLELITTERGFQRPAPEASVAPFAGFLADYLDRREGLAMLVLESADAATDAAHFAREGIGQGAPFFFERLGKRADGGDVHVAFTLAFSRAPGIAHAGFFVCQQHFPEAFWSPALQRHANSASHVAGVTLLHDDPDRCGGFLKAFTGGQIERAPGRLTVDTGRGVVEVLTPAMARWAWDADVLPADLPPGPHLVGIRLAVASLEAARAALQQGGIGFVDQGGRIEVAATAAGGVALAFERS